MSNSRYHSYRMVACIAYISLSCVCCFLPLVITPLPTLFSSASLVHYTECNEELH